MRKQGHSDTHKREATRETPRQRGIRPAAVSQIGEVVGKNPEDWKGEGTLNRGTRFGNEMAEAVPRRPGGGRTVRACGTQGTHGPVNPGSHRPNPTPGEWPDTPPTSRPLIK
jgi:hypothetical protein